VSPVLHLVEKLSKLFGKFVTSSTFFYNLIDLSLIFSAQIKVSQMRDVEKTLKSTVHVASVAHVY